MTCLAKSTVVGRGCMYVIGCYYNSFPRHHRCNWDWNLICGNSYVRIENKDESNDFKVLASFWISANPFSLFGCLSSLSFFIVLAVPPSYLFSLLVEGPPCPAVFLLHLYYLMSAGITLNDLADEAVVTIMNKTNDACDYDDGCECGGEGKY